MKTPMKYLAVLFTVTFIAASVKAQDHKFQIGAVGGGDIEHFSHLTFEESSQYHRTGWSIGLSMQHNMTKRFSIHYKLLFNQSKIDFTLYRSHANGTSPSDRIYIDKSLLVPVLAKWTFGQKRFHWSLDAGMQFKMDFQSIAHVDIEKDISPTYTSNNLGFLTALTSGVGVSYDLTDKFTIATEARLAKYYWYDFDFDKYDFNAQWLISVNYRFGKK